MTERGRAKRVLVIGGGVAGVTAAYELSHPKHKGAYEVTLLQMGWRLGGKGASGRNAAFDFRIEEHGLHVWFGAYWNAMDVMAECYDELARLPAGKESVFKCFDDAFHPQDRVIFQEQWNGGWIPHPVTLPPLPNNPPAGIWDYVLRIVDWVIGMLDRVPDARVPMTQHPTAPDPKLHRWIKSVEADLGRDLAVAERGVHALLTDARDHMVSLGPPEHHTSIGRRMAVAMLEVAANVIWALVRPELDDKEVRWAWRATYFGLTTVVGVLRDDILDHGYDVINGLEFQDWMRRNSPISHFNHKKQAEELGIDTSPFIKTFYETAFAYADGRPDRPSLAAGVMLRAGVRLALGYRRSISFEMQAGMGDTVFSPFYLVLKSWGADVRFFQRVTRITPTPDGRQVGEVHVSQQVRLKGDGYDPLFPEPVEGVWCWPNEPFYGQLNEDPEKLAKYNLEHYDSGWTDTGGDRTLRLGVDFDDVVLAASVACLPVICPDLIARSPRWQTMIRSSATVATQAAQLWFTPGATGLGAPVPPVITGGYVDPYASIADFTHLLKREGWPTGGPPRYLAYTCGVMPDLPGETEQSSAERARKNLEEWLADNAGPLWPKAVDANGRFDWSVLYEGFGKQYTRANIDLAERYVQSPPGSIVHRLRPEDSGFSNLVLAGTWTNTGLNIGAVETAVLSGLQAARGITGADVEFEGETDFPTRART